MTFFNACLILCTTVLRSLINFAIEFRVYDTSCNIAYTAVELDLLSKFSDLSTYVDSRMVLIKNIGSTQQDGLLYFEMPGDGIGGYFVL